MSTSGSVAGDRARVSTKAMKAAWQEDPEEGPSGLHVTPSGGIKVPVPTKFSGKRGTLNEYTTKFQALATRIQWNTASKMAAYRKGLSEEVKDELARMPDVINLIILIQ